MPLVHRSVAPVHCSDGKLELKGKYECEFIAVNNVTLVNVLRQLAGVVDHAADIFSETANLTDQVGKRIRRVKLRLDELEAKTELFDPKLVPVPEGSLDEVTISEKYTTPAIFETRLFSPPSRPRCMGVLFDKAGHHCPTYPPRSPITTLERNKLNISTDTNRRPASFAALRDWKLDDYLDEKIATLTLEHKSRKKSVGELNRALATPFPSQVVQVDVTGQGFDRMRKSRRSLVIHTKRIRRSRRRNTICGSMPNKECGIQTSFSSVNVNGHLSEGLEGEGGVDGVKIKKYGIDSGHWSSSTRSSAVGGGGTGARSTVSAPSPWGGDHASISTSSDFLFDDEDRCLTPQLEHFTDGLVSDSDSVDTDGYFTSFRSDCGFPKSKKASPEEDDIPEGGVTEPEVEGGDGEEGKHQNTSTESEYDLFGKGSTSTTASSCGTVVFRNKPSPPTRTTSSAIVGVVQEGGTPSEIGIKAQTDDTEWVERVKRKSLIERVPSLVVVTPSPTPGVGGVSPPPLKDPSLSSGSEEDSDDRDSGRITPKAEDFSNTNSTSDCGTLSDTDSEMRSELHPRPSSTASTASSGGSEVSTMTLTSAAEPATATSLPQPDVIPDVQIIIRTKGGPSKLDATREYCSLDTVLLNSSLEEESSSTSTSTLRRCRNVDVKMNVPVPPTTTTTSRTTPSPSGSLEGSLSPQGSATSGKIRGARVVLDANGEIIFASETLRRKRRPKVSFDPGSAVKTMDYDNFAPTYGRLRESVYDRIIKKEDGEGGKENEKLYETIEEIRKQNMRHPHPYLHLQEEKSISELVAENKEAKGDGVRSSSSSSNCSSQASTRSNSRYGSRPPISLPQDDPNDPEDKILLETDLDSGLSDLLLLPPSMSDLKNLPKIKDRLKRNESYRIANTDEGKNARANGHVNANANANANVDAMGHNLRRISTNNSPKDGRVTNPRPSLLSMLSPQVRMNSMNNKFNRRMSFSSNKTDSGSPTTSPNGNGDLHLNKKRDILEEDPVFIQQILNLTSANAHNAHGGTKGQGGNNSGNNSSLTSPLRSGHGYGHSHLGSGYSGRITLSKLALSPEDRPTFLRRDNPATPLNSGPEPRNNGDHQDRNPLWNGDSPPTMDDISKEIYRFRKKFNIQPNATSRSLLLPSQLKPTSSSSTPDRNGNLGGGNLRRGYGALSPRKLSPGVENNELDGNGNHYASLRPSFTSTIPIGFPKLVVQSPTPLHSSTPIKPSANNNSAPTNLHYAYKTTTKGPGGVAYPVPVPVSLPLTRTSRPLSSLSNYDSSRSYNESRSIYSENNFVREPFSSNNGNLGGDLRSSLRDYRTQGPHPPPPPPLRNFSSSGIGRYRNDNESIFYPSKITGAFNSSAPTTPTTTNGDYYSGMYSSRGGGGSESGFSGITQKYRRASMSLAEPSPGALNLNLSSARTSLNDFKKLLLAAKPKKNSISAMEALKPKVIGVETTL